VLFRVILGIMLSLLLFKCNFECFFSAVMSHDAAAQAVFLNTFFLFTKFTENVFILLHLYAVFLCYKVYFHMYMV